MKRSLLIGVIFTVPFLPLGYFLHDFLVQMFLTIAKAKLDIDFVMLSLSPMFKTSFVFAMIFSLVPFLIITGWMMKRIASRLGKLKAGLIVLVLIVTGIVVNEWIIFSRIKEFSGISPGANAWPEVSQISFIPGLASGLLASVLINYLVPRKKEQQSLKQ